MIKRQRSMLKHCDLPWVFGKYKDVPQLQEWSGFMELLTKDKLYEKSRIIFFDHLSITQQGIITRFIQL